MSLLTYDHLPIYIRVRISSERWQIAKLVGDEDNAQPIYELIDDKMTQGRSVNRLIELQKQVFEERRMKQ